MSKNKLQELAQRHYLSLPIYTSTKDGPDHAPRFRATVTYNGHVYHSPGYCRSAKQAETAAAEAALSQLSLESEHNPQKMKEPVSVQMEASEMPSNLRRESKKEQQGDMKEETLQQAENVAHISKGGIANVLENSELKAESSQLTQSLLVPFPSSRIQVVKVRELSKSENSGKVADRQNTVRNSSIPEISYNVTNKEQAHRMTVGTMQEKQQTEEVIQQSNGIISTSEFISVPSNLQKESKKEQKGDRDREEETLQEAGDVSCISESGIANVPLPIKSELQAETSQPAQTPCLSCPRLNIQVVPFQGSSMSENSGKETDKQSTGNFSSTPEVSCNETHREQAHKMATGMIEERQWIKEINQQSKGIMSTPQFISDMTKTQLQEFANKGGFDLPCYSSIREGPPHALRFKAAVKFNGETYEGPGFFNTLRQAEHAAATVALKSLLEKGSSLDELSMYKNLLQEKAQKEGKALPVYNTTKSGPPHMPVFTCTVKFDGMTFEGKHANTKKQAEKSAAAVAWPALENS
ncbi:uncharacterized protein LOC131072210 isoform X2 [Cryptomeria japonica]|uniref:uncharacterized protein LOC131072210 isoform X2 n=1 Tax=Cryptomeria japonica TaxID=3369 RepID=UPI0027D9EC10|nr:uncharacterized protein LOC131072210 isoform X2 [Cryptomeria japonica]